MKGRRASEADTVNACAIGGLEISNQPAITMRHEFGMPAADAAIAQWQRLARPTNELRFVRGQWEQVTTVRAVCDLEHEHVDSLREPARVAM